MSSQRPDDDLPFGYSFDNFDPADPFGDPPPKLLGAPLLSDNDNQALNSFLDSIDDHVDLASFGEGLNMDFASLPPTFMGSSTSFGQQLSPSLLSPPPSALPRPEFNEVLTMSPAVLIPRPEHDYHHYHPHYYDNPHSHNHGLNHNHNLNHSLNHNHDHSFNLSLSLNLNHSHSHHYPHLHVPPPRPPSHHYGEDGEYDEYGEQHASADVIEAAKLLQTGSVSRFPAPPPSPWPARHDDAATLITPLEDPLIIQTGPHRHPSPIDHLRQAGLRFHPDAAPLKESYRLPNACQWPAQYKEPSRTRPSPLLANPQWGSDPSFSDRSTGFAPQSERDTCEAFVKEKMKFVDEIIEASQPAPYRSSSSSPSCSSSSPSSVEVSPAQAPAKAHSRKCSEVDREDADPTAAPAKKRKKSTIIGEQAAREIRRAQKAKPMAAAASAAPPAASAARARARAPLPAAPPPALSPLAPPPAAPAAPAAPAHSALALPVSAAPAPVALALPVPAAHIAPAPASPSSPAPAPAAGKKSAKSKALKIETAATRVTAAAKPGPARKKSSGATAATALSDTSPATPATPTSPARRRNLTANKPTIKRENLTQEQKRNNHIASEQRRRMVIKEGFDGLAKVVPGLSMGGFSKSGMLNMACSWLEDLMAQNDRLEAQLGRLQA